MQTITAEQVSNVIREAVRIWGRQAVAPGDGWSVEGIAEAILKHSQRCKVDIALALAQGWIECHFGVNPRARRSRRTLNIYNVGNVDSGADRVFESWEAGIAAYCELMRREYNWKDDPEGWITLESMVSRDVKRPKGGRYATAPQYTQLVQSLGLKVRRLLGSSE